MPFWSMCDSSKRVRVTGRLLKSIEEFACKDSSAVNGRVRIESWLESNVQCLMWCSCSNRFSSDKGMFNSSKLGKFAGSNGSDSVILKLVALSLRSLVNTRRFSELMWLTSSASKLVNEVRKLSFGWYGMSHRYLFRKWPTKEVSCVNSDRCCKSSYSYVLFWVFKMCRPSRLLDLENKETNSLISDDKIGEKANVVSFNIINHFLLTSRKRRLDLSS